MQGSTGGGGGLPHAWQVCDWSPMTNKAATKVNFTVLNDTPPQLRFRGDGLVAVYLQQDVRETEISQTMRESLTPDPRLVALKLQ